MSDGSQGTTSGNSDTVQFLAFKMDDREYALNLKNVVQIIRMISITRAPQTPDSVEGMFNLRGRNIPVVDVRKECGLPTRPCGLNTPLVIARSNGHVMALTVDAVSDVLTLPITNIEPRAPVAPELAHVWAIGKVADRALFILDPSTLWTEQV
ncbi:MAG: chemotaxis protein CheW [Anaerolineales bacterium]|nr:chemotaxis protein CheW [Anaerolineales bacterium]